MRKRFFLYRPATLALHAVHTASGRRRQAAPSTPDQPVHVLLVNAFAMGGTVRATLNLAGELARSRPVEIVSLIRGRPDPFLAFPSNVVVRVLADRTPGGSRGLLGRALDRLPSALLHPNDPASGWGSLWTDVQLYRAVRSRRGVLVTTRPAFAAVAARFASRGLRVVAQEHRNLAAYTPELRAELRRTYPRLDLLATLTRADEDAFHALLGARAPQIERVPNAVPRLTRTAGGPRAKVILGAGRLLRGKGFDLLLQAFAEIAHEVPDWTVRIHGDGPDRELLLGMIQDLGLVGRAQVCPPTPHIGDVLASASIFALSSRSEGLPMALLEAMSMGTAVAAFDCPTGPAEVLTHESNGLLVPPEDATALGKALLRLIDDPELRASVGAAAERTAREGYDVSVIAARWTRLLEEVGRP